MIKSFRRSKRQSSTSSSPKHSISRVSSLSNAQGIDIEKVLQSPKKVIKALYDYDPQGPGELKFKKGDFFHVLTDDSDNDNNDNSNGWYEATNPMTHAKGMVPISYFEVFNRNRPLTSDSPPSAHTSTMSHPDNPLHSSQSLYAVTLYEFQAEREDELDIEAGENLIICAHHDYEWFIAKPINRLGGPGLVPISYVKIIDLLNPASTKFDFDPSDNEALIKTIDSFKIPTVEQWKDQTAKYQASTIPLGSISNSNTPPISSNTQFFEGNSESNRSSLSSSNTNIIEVSVDSYQLDHGRYQYLIIARLSNGKLRHLYRYYQDFYDLQVKLLELFPFEAGKIENSKRIIPSIPGPLINVNDSISKLRREKLDYYLRNLIALPNHISRSEEVLRLFEVLDNGFDKEYNADGGTAKRTSKPISQQSNYQQDRLSQYSNFHNNQSNSSQTRTSSTPTSADSTGPSRSRSSSNGNLINNASGLPMQLSNNSSDTKQAKVKVKFYYEEDIFVLLLPTNLRLQDLKTKLFKRLDLDDPSSQKQAESPSDVRLFLKNDYDDFLSENDIANEDFKDFSEIQRYKLKEFEVDDDDKFHGILFDKCKLVILV
ncbi:Bud emergence mediator [Scheffersomyces xylosifermentans]|uniref:Bud emergence mediator n=1 Tax=Scheffersomyces xylosifermentans TaxID=1304137 RepID=UPI00315CEC05